jgi:hypothetical protein
MKRIAVAAVAVLSLAFAACTRTVVVHQPSRSSSSASTSNLQANLDTNGDRVVQVVKNRFAPDRMAYFATSAIGFRPGPDGTVNLDDCSNVELDGEPKIIGELRPMNVLEPLIWLEDRIRSSRRRGPGDDR